MCAEKPLYRVSVYDENGWTYMTYYSVYNAREKYILNRGFGYLCMFTFLR